MLLLLYILVLVGLYLLIGIAYTLKESHEYDEDWDTYVMLLWPIIMWRKWRLSRYIKLQNKKWDDPEDG
jgi:hypothetical protein